MEMTFGKTVKNARQVLSLKVDDFISKLGRKVSRAYWTKVELHGEIPTKDLVVRIALVLGLDEVQLIELAKDGKRKQFERLLNEKYM